MVDRRALILALLALGGCSTPPGSTTDPASTDTAELVLSRPGDRTPRNVTAVVEVNGVRAVELERGEGFTAPIRPGPTLVSVSGAPHPGHYSISFSAQAGKTYRLEVSSRSRDYMPSAREMAADYTTVENEGPFKLVAQPPSDRSR
ncbi:MAG TPA: hypothetical protein VFB68_04440 [Xanthobacteraceae bacterium]|nr:hypothetical protein [Xanthobacteraceae bacterium]